jgi:membrane-bound ClpP family serine protease
MKKIFAIILIIVGVAFCLLFGLFLMAGSSYLGSIGLPALIIGIVCLVLGVNLNRNADSNAPVTIDNSVVTLASQKNGIVTADLVVAELGYTREQALSSLDRLQGRGSCRIELRESGQVWVFEQVKGRKMIRKCSFCGRKYPVSEPVTKCPNCGGQVNLQTED